MTKQDDEHIVGVETINDNYDSPWKDAVEDYFPEFMSHLRCSVALDFPSLQPSQKILYPKFKR